MPTQGNLYAPGTGIRIPGFFLLANYNAARGIFWNDLYPGGGFTVYCAQPFARNLGLEVEHVYQDGTVRNP